MPSTPDATLHQVDTASPSRTQDARVSSSAAVGQSAESLTDEEREQAAYRAGCAMQAWYSLYQHTGDVKHLDRAYEALGTMKRLLAARSPEYVAQLESARGLDLPACANEERNGIA